MKTIKAFGKFVDREAAYEIILNYWTCCLFCPEDLNALNPLLFGGWKPFKEWTDTELEDFIEEHCDEEHEQEGANYREDAPSLHG